MKKIMLYLDLIRFSSQTGTVLLFIPCLCGLVYASNVTGEISVYDCLLLYMSAFLARSCGCILNDIADSKIDANIPTTSHRVLASRQLTIKQALFFCIILVLIGLPFLFFYSIHIFLPLIFFGIITIIYPYSKRFFAVPQVLLGIVYASGFIIAVVHSLMIPFWQIDMHAFVVYIALVLWVIFYDTIYAKRDFEYDAILNVNSSAVFFVKVYKTSILLLILLFCLLSLRCDLLFWIIYMFMICSVLLVNKYLVCSLNERKINNILIFIASIANIVLVDNMNFVQSVSVFFVFIIQCVSLFVKPQYGFKINMLCVIPLLFIM